MLFVTDDGFIKKTCTSEILFSKHGQDCFKLKDNNLIYCDFCDKSEEIILITTDKMLIKFNHQDIRATGRIGVGVKAIKLEKKDFVTDVYLVSEKNREKEISISEEDNEVQFKISDLKLQNRAGKGIKVKFK